MKFYSTWRNIIRRVGLEELGMVIFLSNNHNKLGAPFLIKKLACLQNEIRKFIHKANKMSQQAYFKIGN